MHKFEVKSGTSLGNKVDDLQEVMEMCVFRNVHAILMLLSIASSNVQRVHNFSQFFCVLVRTDLFALLITLKYDMI